MRRAVAAALLASCTSPALADPAPSYAQLLRQALANAPAIAEQAANVRAAQAEARQSRAMPNPMVEAVAENLAIPQTAGSGAERQTTFTITQPLEIGGKRSARIAAGEGNLTTAQARDRQARIAFAADLAIAYATAEAMQDRQKLAADDLGRAREDLRAARALVTAGKEADLRITQANASVAAAIAAEEAAAADTFEALERLSAMAGAATPYTCIDRSLLAVAAPKRVAVGPTLDDPPAVATAVAERNALAAQVRIEQKRSIPDIGLSAGLRRFQGNGDSALVVGVSATIPLFDRNRGNIAAARERANAADARLAAARLEAGAARRVAAARVAAATGRLDAANQGEAAAEEAYRLGRIGYDAGKIPLLELLTIRRALTEARALTIDARLGRVRALAALAQADGQIAFGD
ncbi:TolC family protein [Sphingomonas oligophenolica]|uniref:TolC family protein n=1 Tax=Sphingomonas oligophenolica TaxID=301154 RepID=A0ABU9Y525_9SPHN